MIVPGSSNPLLMGVSTGYNLTRSLRFRSSASAYLSRTPASAGNRKTFTYSAWVKRGTFNLDANLYSGTVNASSQVGSIIFNGGSDKLRVFDYQAGSLWNVETASVYRDPSAWYHVVVAIDTTQATASNRVKIYVNGSQVTSFSTANYPTQNTDTFFNYNNTQAIGRYAWSAGSGDFDGYITEVNFIDGQALTPSSFGATSSTTGVWQPKKYTGTYGTNGFYLPFTDNSALTSGSNAGLGKDFSGNGNYWNTNNISITSGSTYDSMTDVPTLTSATASNYCVLNPLKVAASGSFSNGNLSASVSGASNATQEIHSTFKLPSSGKWYFEASPTTLGSIAIGLFSDEIAFPNSRIVAYSPNGEVVKNASTASSGLATYTTSDIIGVAVDVDASTVAFYKNNSLIYTATSVLYINQATAGFAQFSSAGSCAANLNFGQRPFAYTPPTGYVALNTFNLPTPTIGATATSQANKYFSPTLYTGTGGSSTNVTGVGFQPDLVWLKNRTTAWNNCLFDAVRGTGKLLQSNLTNAETTNDTWGYLSAFNSDGFTLTAGATGIDQVSQSGNGYVAWNWKANGSGSSNTAGSITSTVSANTTSGFSVVTYTGNGTGGATVGHGLGVAPKMYIVKIRNGVDDWLTYHASLGATQFLKLNSTIAASTSTVWNNTAPTSSVFSLGTSTGVNNNGSTFVAYCFAEIAGFSKFGSFTANNSSDGNFIYLGFRPRWIMCKQTSGSGGAWFILDTARNTYNVMNNILDANSSGAERNDNIWDATANGMKLRIALSGDFVYAAFSENPFKYSLAR